MERLTKCDRVIFTILKHAIDEHTDFDGDMIEKMLNKLAAYEDAEEGGRLTVLPCKIGDTVYIPHNGEIAERQVTGWDYDPYVMKISLSDAGYRDVKLIGKTMFFTRAEAEAALARREGAGTNDTDD